MSNNHSPHHCSSRNWVEARNTATEPRPHPRSPRALLARVAGALWERLFVTAFLIAGMALATPLVQAGGNCEFIRGDANGDQSVTLVDSLVVLSFLFTGGSAPEPLDRADANDDGSVGLVDPLVILNYLFVGGLPPVAPFPQAGLDPTPDQLPSSCVSTLLDLSAEEPLLESDSLVAFSVHAMRAFPETYTVSFDGVVDPNVTVEVTSQEQVDADGDGIAEEYFADLVVQLGAGGIPGTSVVRVQSAGFDFDGNPIDDHLDIAVLPHVVVHLPMPVVTGVNGALIPVDVDLRNVNLLDAVSWSVLRDGVDITAQVLIEVATSPATSGERSGTVDSTYSLTLVGDSLGALPGSTVEIVATLQPGGFSGANTLQVVVAQPVVPMLDTKLCDLFEALGASVDADGNVCVDMSGDDATVKNRIANAVSTFRSAVRECLDGEFAGNRLTFEGEKVLSDGTTLPYCIVLGREQTGTNEDKDATAGDLDKEQAIIIAAGGDSPSDTTPGGGAVAKGGAGSVAIGVGGAGSGSRKGGDGEARSKDGKAIGIGGTGGSVAGQGGTGKARGYGGASGFAGGGKGGDPADDSDSGGHGGGARVENDEGVAKQKAGADGGGRGSRGTDGPGTHGTGATAKADAGEEPESTAGTAEENES